MLRPDARLTERTPMTRRFRLLPGAALLVTVLALSGCTLGQEPDEPAASSASTVDLADVSPALASYDSEIVEQLWERDQLSERDRSLITVALLVSTGSTTGLDRVVERALDDGVTPEELSEAVTHLGFYSGWQNARDAAAVLASAYADRGVDANELPELDPELLPLDLEADDARAAQVEQDFGALAPDVAANTTDVLFRDLWLRPGLASRDRSLVTVVTLVGSGQVQQIPFHLNRAMDSGLTQPEVSETMNHLAFFAGWPRVFSALPVVRDTLVERG